MMRTRGRSRLGPVGRWKAWKARRLRTSRRSPEFRWAKFAGSVIWWAIATGARGGLRMRLWRLRRRFSLGSGGIRRKRDAPEVACTGFGEVDQIKRRA